MPSPAKHSYTSVVAGTGGGGGGANEGGTSGVIPRAAPRNVKATSKSTVNERFPSNGGAKAGLASTGRMVTGGATRRVVKPTPKVTAPGESVTGQRKGVARRKIVTTKPVSPTSAATDKGRQVDELDRGMQTLVYPLLCRDTKPQ